MEKQNDDSSVGLATNAVTDFPEVEAPPPVVQDGIVDADSIMFNLGWWLDKADIIPKEADTSRSTSVPPEVQTGVTSFLHKLRTAMNVETLHLHFTASAKNERLFNEFVGRPMEPQFRSLLDNTYKANRSGADSTPLPLGYHLTLRALLQEPNSYMHDQWEADDAVILQKKCMPDAVLSSNDKDVWKQHFGLSYLYDKRAKWMEVPKHEANFFHFVQAITGDVVDGFGGVPGIGPKKVLEWISPNNSPSENWAGVLAAFESKGLGEDAALFNIRCSSMHQLRIGQDGSPYIDLWKPDEFHLSPSWD